MERTSNPAELPPASVTPTRVLIRLYRSTFVEQMQERFRSMLKGAYVPALKGDFEPMLRAHFIDVLQEIQVRAAELAEVFAEALLDSFQPLAERSMGAHSSVDGIKTTKQPVAPTCIDEDPMIREFVAKTICGIETHSAGSILRLARFFVQDARQSAENFDSPWSPASVFAAFAVVLRSIDMPIHGRVKLTLYKIFAREVLNHIEDSCLVFRDALPNGLSQLQIPGCGDKSTGGLITDMEMSLRPANFVTALDKKPDPNLDLTRDPETHAENGERDASSNTPNERYGKLVSEVRVKKTPKRNSSKKTIRLTIFLLATFGLAWSAWWLGRDLGRIQSIPVLFRETIAEVQFWAMKKLSMEARRKQEAGAQESLPLPQEVQISAEPKPVSQGTGAEPSSVSQVSAVQPSLTETGTEAAQLTELRGKREVMRAVKLKNFSWRIDQSENRMLFNLTVANNSPYRISGIELVCSQYTEALDFLEAAKTILEQPIEPGGTKTFDVVPIGFANKQNERVNCIIADLAVASHP